MAVQLIITNAGRAALIDASHTGTNQVTVASVGVSPTAFAAGAGTLALPGEIKRIAMIGGDDVAPDVIHLLVRDESNDTYTMRSFALYLADGTLFGVYSQADPIIEKSSSAILLMAIDITLADIPAAAITFGDTDFVDPPGTTARAGVIRLATTAIVQAGVDAATAVTPASLAGGFATLLGQVWRATNDGAGSGLDADLLDGQDGGYYTNIAARLGFMPVRQGGGVGQLDNAVLVGWSAGGRLKATVDVTDQGNIVFDSHIADVWRASNDGAGSGLDADLLDGLQGSQYLRGLTDLWTTSADGTQRFYFMQGGITYHRVNGSVVFQNNAQFNVATIDEAGNQSLSGNLGAQRVYARANGDGRAIYVGDDAVLGDVNQGGVVSIRGQQDFNQGYVVFGNSDSVLGCNANDSILRYGGGVLWHSGNDGSGSGLDADLLDGLNSTSFARLGQNASFADVFAQRPDGTGVIYFGTSGEHYLYWNGGNYELRGAPLYINGGLAWHSGNDGAGSGLDADLLDGHDSSEFDRVVSSNLVQNGGYITFANGLKRCWGFVDVGSGASVNFFYPISFSDWARVTSAHQVAAGNTGQSNNIGIVNNPGLSYLTIYNAEHFSLRFWVEVEGV